MAHCTVDTNCHTWYVISHWCSYKGIKMLCFITCRPYSLPSVTIQIMSFFSIDWNVICLMLISHINNRWLFSDVLQVQVVFGRTGNDNKGSRWNEPRIRPRETLFISPCNQTGVWLTVRLTIYPFDKQRSRFPRRNTNPHKEMSSLQFIVVKLVYQVDSEKVFAITMLFLIRSLCVSIYILLCLI